MDLGTMGQKVPMYPMIPSYERDLRLIVDNCTEYNGPASPITAAAAKLWKDSAVEIRKAKRELKKHVNVLLRPYAKSKAARKEPARKEPSVAKKGKQADDSLTRQPKRSADNAFSTVPNSRPGIVLHMGGVPVSSNDDAAWKRARVESSAGPSAARAAPAPAIFAQIPDIEAAAERAKRVVDDAHPQSVMGCAKLGRGGSMAVVVRHGGPEVAVRDVVPCSAAATLEPLSRRIIAPPRQYGHMAEFFEANPTYTLAPSTDAAMTSGVGRPALIDDAETDGYLDTDTKAYCESIRRFTAGLGGMPPRMLPPCLALAYPAPMAASPHVLVTIRVGCAPSTSSLQSDGR